MRLCLLLFAICCLACAGGLPNKPAFENTQEVVVVPLAQLHDEGRQNPRQTVGKYQGKSVLVSGTVLAHHPEQSLPALSVWDGKKGVLCKFLQQERDRVRKCNADSRITVVGNVFLGPDEKHVELLNCTIRNQSP